VRRVRFEEYPDKVKEAYRKEQPAASREANSMLFPLVSDAKLGYKDLNHTHISIFILLLILCQL